MKPHRVRSLYEQPPRRFNNIKSAPEGRIWGKGYPAVEDGAYGIGACGVGDDGYGDDKINISDDKINIDH